MTKTYCDICGKEQKASMKRSEYYEAMPLSLAPVVNTHDICASCFDKALVIDLWQLVVQEVLEQRGLAEVEERL